MSPHSLIHSTMGSRNFIAIAAILLIGGGSALATSTVTAHYKMGELEVAGGAALGATATTLLPSTGATQMPVSGTPSIQAGGANIAIGGSTHFMSFDGTTQRFDVSPNLLGSGKTDGWMVEAWVRPQAGGSGLGLIVTHGTGGSGQCLNYDAAADRYGWYVGGSGQINGSVGASGIGTTWDHLALVRESGTTRLYVNGSLAGSNTAAGTTPYANGSSIGTQFGGGSNHGFTGDIDEVYFSTVSAFDAVTDLHRTSPAGPRIEVPAAVQNPGTIITSTTTTVDVLVSNLGTTNPLVIHTVTGLTGDAGKFSLQTPLPVNVPPGEVRVLTFNYAPGATAGNHAATFSIGSNDPAIPNATVSLAGASIIDPNLVPPSTLSFGTVPVSGITSKTLLVENSGFDENLTVSAAIVSGDTAFFTISNAPSSLAPGFAGNLVIECNPHGAPGSHSAVLEITHNDPDVASPVQLTLSATAAQHFTTIAHYMLGEDDSNLLTSVDAVGDYDVTNINGTPGTSYNAGSGAAGSTVGIDNALNDVYRHSGIPSELAGRTTNWGIEAWIRPELSTGSSQIGSGYGGLYFGVGHGSRGGFSIFSIDGAHWGLNIGGIATRNSVAPIRGSTWTHVAAVAVGNQVRLYVNGILAHTYAGNPLAPDDTFGGAIPNVELGGQVAPSYRSAGGLDEARIFTFIPDQFNLATDLHITPPADADGDGLADLWEDRYFGNNDGLVTWADLTATDGSGNQDGDALSDQEEHDRRSDPTDPNDPALLITGINKTAGTCSVTFTGIDGLTYVLKKSLLLNDNFPIVVDTITLSGTSSGTMEDTNATEPKAFYRVEPAD